MIEPTQEQTKKKQSSWQKTTVSVYKTGSFKEREVVDGWVNDDLPGLAVTRSLIDEKYWIVTHIPTGKSIGPLAKLRKLQRLALEHLKDIDWLQDEAALVQNRAAVLVAREFARAAYQS